MSSTTTRSASDTHSEARVAHVMDKVYDDLLHAHIRGFISAETAASWREEIGTVLNLRAVEFFQVQFTRPGGERCALKYTVSSNGEIEEDRPSGGIDFYAFPAGTKVNVTLRLVDEAKPRQKGTDYLKGKGWTFDGTMVEGVSVRDKTYSKDGYAVTREKIGKWS